MDNYKRFSDMDTTVYANSSRVKKRVRHSARAVRKVNKLSVAKWIAAAVLVVTFTVLTEVLKKPDLTLFFILGVGLIVLFHKEFSIRQYSKTYLKGWQPWVWTVVTVALLYGAEQLKNYLLWNVFVTSKPGIISLYWKENYPGVAFYAITMIIILPLAENLFFRKAMLASSNKLILVLMTFVSLAVRGLLYAHGFTGILSYAIVAVPLTLVFLKTKNVYITLTAQIIISAYVVIPDIVYYVARLMLR